MENITRTVYGSFLQTCHLLGRPFQMLANSTLNEKFGIASGLAPDISQTPLVQYWAIGNGGHKMTVGAGGIAKSDPIQHRATDAACFNHLPFVLREPGADLSAAQRMSYGLRRKETHNGVDYIAYYLKRISMDGVTPAIEYKSVADGTTTTTPFVPNSSNLNPTPPQLNAQGVNVTTGDYTTCTAKITLALSADEITELLNVAQILYADDGYAIISEIALVSGVDRMVVSPGVGTATINFNDVIAAQVVSFLNTFFSAKFQSSGTSNILDVGATEPMFSLQ